MRLTAQLFTAFLCLQLHAQDFIELSIEGRVEGIQLDDTSAISRVLFAIDTLSVDSHQKSKYLLLLGEQLVDNYQYQSADRVLKSSLQIASDSSIIAEAYFNLGLSTMYRDIRIQSLNHFHQALRIYTALNDSSLMGRSLDKIADNHNYIGEHDIARPYYDQALAIFTALKDTSALTNVLGNIGGMLSEENLQDSALTFYDQSIRLNERAGNLSNLSDDLAGKAMAYEELGDTQNAYKLYLSAFEVAHRGGNEEDKAFANQHMGYYHFRTGHFDSTIHYMTITYDYAKEMNYSQLLINSLDVLHQAHFAKGNYQQAYTIFKEAAILNDSLLSLENVSLINSLRAEYEMERQAATNEALLNEAALREKYIQGQVTLNTLLIFGALLLILSLVFLVLLNRNRKLKNKIISSDRDLIKEQSEKLKEADRLKSAFFANVAHDFRAPITLLKGFADLIRINQPNLTEESKEYIDQIHETAKRLTAMTEEINQLIQLEHSQYQLKKEQIDVNELFGTIGKMYQLGRQNKSIDFIFQSSVPKDTIISADRSALEKIIFNLIGNAFKYNTTGKEVTMKLSIENQCVKMIVCDDGPGIQEDKIEKVFERYYRTEKGSETASGLGIGLSLVKDMVELHGGQVCVTSSPGIETCFTVKLPLGHQ